MAENQEKRGRRATTNVLTAKPGSKVTDFKAKADLFHKFFDRYILIFKFTIIILNFLSDNYE